jgi:hypothetical protein
MRRSTAGIQLNRFSLLALLAALAVLQPVQAQKSAGSQAAAGVRLSKPMRDIGKALAVSPEALNNADLRVITADRVVEPDKVSNDTDVKQTVLVQRTGSVLRELPAEDESSRSLDTQPIAAYALPIRFHALAKLPGETSSRPVEFEAVLMVMNALRFRESSRRFEADLVVGLRNPAAPKDRSILSEPVKLFVSASGDEVAPGEIEIGRLGDPRVVKISSLSPAAPYKVSAKTLLDDGDTVEVPIVRPTLRLKATRGSIGGWGLEKTMLHVQAEGVANAAGMHVALHTSQGDVKPEGFELDANGSGTAQLRSDGVGMALLSASGVPFSSSEEKVEFVKPWSFLVAALLGAIAGWVVRTRARSKSLRSALVAVASAAIVTAAYSIGIRLAQWAPEATVGEALTFFVAAIGAYLGIKAIMPVREGG